MKKIFYTIFFIVPLLTIPELIFGVWPAAKCSSWFPPIFDNRCLFSLRTSLLSFAFVIIVLFSYFYKKYLKTEKNKFIIAYFFVTLFFACAYIAFAGLYWFSHYPDRFRF